MKIRTDFVSNSSSSSFIFYGTDFFEVFNITKEKIENALISLYGKDRYNEAVKQSGKPFEVFDLLSSFDVTAALEKYNDLLSNWDQYVPTAEDYLYSMSSNIRNFRSFLLAVNEAYDAQVTQGTLEELKEAKQFSQRWADFGRWLSKHPILNFFLKKYVQRKLYVPLKRSVKKIISEVREKLKIKTNAELLTDSDTRFFIHFEDNEIYGLSGIQDDEDDAESYSFDRFMQLLFKKVCEQNSIKMNDSGQVALTITDESTGNSTTRMTYSYKEFRDDATASYVMHEG